MPFKDTKEGQTHSQNDNCGETAHNEPMMSNETLLELIEHLAANSPAEDVKMDMSKKQPVTERERYMAETLINIYKFVHSHGDCRHPDWQEEAEVVYNKAVKNGLI